MRFVFALIVVALLLLLATTLADEAPDSVVAADSAEVDDTLSRWVLNDSFGLGEHLTFSIGYGFITAGTATLAVADTQTYENRLCYRILSETASNSFVDRFYKVRDTSLSLINVDGLYAHYFSKSLNEGSYHSQREVIFDYQALEAYYRKDAETVDTLGLVTYTQDVLSAMYYLRTQPLQVGETWSLPTVSGDTLTELKIKVLGRETIDVPAGEFDCLVLEPLLTATGIFKHEGKIKVWVTDDRLHMPVLMKSKVLVGSIYAELERFELGDLDW
jgi:hypothetical protein